ADCRTMNGVIAADQRTQAANASPDERSGDHGAGVLGRRHLRNRRGDRLLRIVGRGDLWLGSRRLRGELRLSRQLTSTGNDGIMPGDGATGCGAGIGAAAVFGPSRSEEHTSELQSLTN